MYILSFVIAMLAPAAILGVGIWWKVSPPPFQAKGLAYRSALACASQEAWAFAHKNCARLWVRIGLLLTLATAGLMWFLRDGYQSFFLWLLVAQMAFFCISSFLVELLLKGTFDEQGRPLNK